MINNYSNPYLSPYVYPQTSSQMTQPMQAPNNAIIWVQGETGAKSYSVPAGGTALLMDSESRKFYIKSVDASGIPMPLRTFEYNEVVAEVTPTTDYITREEFEKKIAELTTTRKAGKKDE